MAPLVIRRLGSELLDSPGGDPRIVGQSLRNIARANRWFGGLAALRYGLRRRLGRVRPGARLTLLDVGTGFGDVPRAAVAWGARRGLRIIPIGLERNRIAARLAHEGGIPTILGCAGRPPVADKSVDLVIVSLVAHHFEPDSVVELLRTCDRLARRAVIVSELRRARLGVLAFRVGARLLRFDPATVADGVTSIQRAYTVSELAGLLARAGLAGEVARRPGYRLVASWVPEPA